MRPARSFCKPELPLLEQLRLEFLRVGLLLMERPLTIFGLAISLTLVSISGTLPRTAYFDRYLRFMLKKLREQGRISWRTRMMLVNISDVTF